VREYASCPRTACALAVTCRCGRRTPPYNTCPLRRRNAAPLFRASELELRIRAGGHRAASEIALRHARSPPPTAIWSGRCLDTSRTSKACFCPRHVRSNGHRSRDPRRTTFLYGRAATVDGDLRAAGTYPSASSQGAVCGPARIEKRLGVVSGTGAMNRPGTRNTAAGNVMSPPIGGLRSRLAVGERAPRCAAASRVYAGNVPGGCRVAAAFRLVPTACAGGQVISARIPRRLRKQGD
jgi:hypothetical protein